MNTPTGLGNQEPPVLSFGQKAAGVTFNPGGDPNVDLVKQKIADLIDFCHSQRNEPNAKGEAARYYSKAISHLEDGQMNIVKAITWKW